MSYRNYSFFGYVGVEAPFQKYETSTDNTAMKLSFSEELVMWLSSYMQIRVIKSRI